VLLKFKIPSAQTVMMKNARTTALSSVHTTIHTEYRMQLVHRRHWIFQPPRGRVSVIIPHTSLRGTGSSEIADWKLVQNKAHNGSQMSHRVLMNEI